MSMKVHMDAEEWRAQLALNAAQQVRRHRELRGLSVQRVADICAEEYGLPIKRTVLANFEGGRRSALSVAELLVLARILQIPPVQLLFPIGTLDEVEVLPGMRANTWEALKWFAGECDRLPGDDQATQNADPVRAFHRHDSTLDRFHEHYRNLKQMIAEAALCERGLDAVAPEDRSSEEARLQNLVTTSETWAMAAEREWQSLLDLRAQMEKRGLTPPPLEDLGAEVTRIADAAINRYRKSD